MKMISVLKIMVQNLQVHLDLIEQGKVKVARQIKVEQGKMKCHKGS